MRHGQRQSVWWAHSDSTGTDLVFLLHGTACAELFSATDSGLQVDTLKNKRTQPGITLSDEAPTQPGMKRRGTVHTAATLWIFFVSIQRASARVVCVVLFLQPRCAAIRVPFLLRR